MLVLDQVETAALAGLVLFLGYWLTRAVPPLARYNIPGPVVGGLLVSMVAWAAHGFGVTLLQAEGADGTSPSLLRIDRTLRTPFMIAFFTTIGFGARLSLLRVGGPLVLVFFAAATAVAVLQNVIGASIAAALGQPPLLGVLAGSVTLTGGPATGLAFADLFERANVHGAASIAVASAMAGIISGGLIGGPIGTLLIERQRPGRQSAASPHAPRSSAADIVEDQLPEPGLSAPPFEDASAHALLKATVAILAAMWLGVWVSRGVASAGLTLPAYIGAMIVGAIIRNVDDATGMVGLSQQSLDDLGSVALSLFLALALMTLELWQIAGLALPLTLILSAQVALVAAVSLWLIPRVTGRDYDAAVISSGFCGFMLGTVANSMANMEALVRRYGPAPKAFLVVPIVGAFLIDFTNALIITAALNLAS